MIEPSDLEIAAFVFAMMHCFGDRAFSMALRQVRLAGPGNDALRETWYEIAASIFVARRKAQRSIETTTLPRPETISASVALGYSASTTRH